MPRLNILKYLILVKKSYTDSNQKVQNYSKIICKRQAAILLSKELNSIDLG